MEAEILFCMFMVMTLLNAVLLTKLGKINRRKTFIDEKVTRMTERALMDIRAIIDMNLDLTQKRMEDVTR